MTDREVPEHVVNEFRKALDQHEKDMRKGLTKHLDHIEKHNIPQDSVHHLDVGEDD